MWFLVLGEVMLRILEVKKHGARVSWERPQFSLTGYPAFSLSLLTCNLCNLSHEAFSGSPFSFPPPEASVHSCEHLELCPPFMC